MNPAGSDSTRERLGVSVMHAIERMLPTFFGIAWQVTEDVFTYVAVFRIKAAAGVKCSRLPLRITIHICLFWRRPAPVDW